MAVSGKGRKVQIFRKKNQKRIRWDPLRTGLENMEIFGDRPCAYLGEVEGIQNTYSIFFPACDVPVLELFSGTMAALEF